MKILISAIAKLGSMAYMALIGPLELVFSVIFQVVYNHTFHAGFSIIVLSLAMNFLVLPLYKRADAIQSEEAETEKRLSGWVSHIKKHFYGDEKFMVLQTYYRQNNYKPTYALKGSLSLLLEIPFFIAAYHFLSTLAVLEGSSFGPIADLGVPDGLLRISGMSISILPLIMTAVNILSGAIYTKGMTKKAKVQLYGMAVIFLIFLYPSPAGLVFYWTCNNLFSLIKNIVSRLPLPKRKLFRFARTKQAPVTVDHRIFTLGVLLLSVLTGILIPSAVIASSAQEFIQLSGQTTPLQYVLNSACYAFGFFGIWLTVFYRLATPRAKVFWGWLVWILCGISVCDYMFFGKNLGILSNTLVYENTPTFALTTQIINAAVLLAIILICTFLFKKKPALPKTITVTCLITAILMSGMNIHTIHASYNEASATLSANANASSATVPLSANGENVIVIMMDRMLGFYLPYIMHENQTLKDQFAGFTFYSNTTSFGFTTNIGSPGLYGGYEYTPEEMNKRSDELLTDKHNEALKVMPVLFDENGYQVTIFNPTYANYQWIPDITIYDDYPNIHAYLTEGTLGHDEFVDTFDLDHASSLSSEFFCYSIMKIAPLSFQTAFYDDGNYNRPVTDAVALTQTYENYTHATGLRESTMNAYYELKNLPEVIEVTEDTKGSFFMMSSNLAHEIMLFSENGYVPSATVDNTPYEPENVQAIGLVKTDDDGNTLTLRTASQVMHYHVNMAAMIQLGNLMDALRDRDVYDNTRIILVSDHGRPIDQFPDAYFDGKLGPEAAQAFLMVKDFHSTEFTVDTTFMTNADVPTLAMQDVIDNPVNPFTGKPIDSSAKYERPIHVYYTAYWNTAENNGTTFVDDGRWYEVHDNVWDINNWSIYK